VMATKRVSRVSRNLPFLPGKQAHAQSLIGQVIHPPFFCFDGYGLTLNLYRNKIGEIRPKPTFLHPYHLYGRETAQVQPPTCTLDPKLIILYAEASRLCIGTIG